MFVTCIVNASLTEPRHSALKLQSHLRELVQYDYALVHQELELRLALGNSDMAFFIDSVNCAK